MNLIASVLASAVAGAATKKISKDSQSTWHKALTPAVVVITMGLIRWWGPAELGVALATDAAVGGLAVVGGHSTLKNIQQWWKTRG